MKGLDDPDWMTRMDDSDLMARGGRRLGDGLVSRLANEDVRESIATSPLHFGLRFGIILDPPTVVRSAARRIAGERRLRLESPPRADHARSDAV
jgi:hypothetical protein